MIGDEESALVCTAGSLLDHQRHWESRVEADQVLLLWLPAQHFPLLNLDACSFLCQAMLKLQQWLYRMVPIAHCALCIAKPLCAWHAGASEPQQL